MDNIEPEPEIVKKICPEPKLRLPQKFDISVIDHDTPKKYFKLKTLQNLILWIFTKNQVNPLWLTVNNKHLIRCGVIINIGFTLDIEESPFLKQFNQKDRIVNFAQFDQSKFNIWQSLFYTKYHEEPVFKTLKCPNQELQNGELYEQKIHKRFNNFTLTIEQLKLNLYPVDPKLYHDYQILKNIPDSSINIVAIDCEMVTTEFGFELARVSVVDYDYKVVLDELVMPTNPILDYNTKYSGISYETLKNVKTTLADIQVKLLQLLNKETLIIGHSLENDFNALKLIHYKCIDTSILYITESQRKIALKNLAYKYLNLTIQQDTHDSIEDAKIALALARLRIETLDHFAVNMFTPTSAATPDVLLQLKKFGGIHVVENKVDIQALLKFDICFEDAEQVNEDQKMKKMVDLLKQRNANAPNPKFIFAQLENKPDDFEQLFEQMYSNAPQQTLFILSLGGKLQQIMFIPK